MRLRLTGEYSGLQGVEVEVEVEVEGPELLTVVYFQD